MLQETKPNAYGPNMQAIKQWKYCWYLDFVCYIWFIGSENLVSFLFWKEKWQGFDTQYCSFP